MSLSLFLSGLREGGRVRVPPPKEISQDELSEALTTLREMDRDARLEAPLAPPPLSDAAALWGAVALFRATQCLTFREIGAEDVKKVLAQACPEPASASAAWSADLALRALPDLVALARGAAEEDPLVEGLLALARAWPLSSVGVRGLGAVDVGAFADHPALLRLYADRVIEKKDAARLDDPRVREAAREALGIHDDLCPEIAAALQTENAR